MSDSPRIDWSTVEFSDIRLDAPAGTPMHLAEFICAANAAPMRGGTLTTAGRDTRVGGFLAEAVGRTHGVVETYPAERYPLLVPDTGLGSGQTGTVGIAFEQWLRLRTDPEPQFPEVAAGMRTVARHAPALAKTIDRVGEALPLLSADPDRLARVAIVLGWVVPFYRRLGLWDGSPLAALAARRRAVTVGDLLAAVPAVLVDQLRAITALAEQQLLPRLAAAATLRQPLLLHRAPLAAEGDLLVDDLLLDLKAGVGARTDTGGRRWAIRPEHVRQLVGYALLAPPEWGVRRIGVYAARYGLTWTAELEPLLADLSGLTGTLDDWRAAFAHLWHDYTPPRRGASLSG
ncbi:MAG: hypothetical protein ACTHMS_03195 [Jatrophihabitans sp.]|uniref:hypothetical protein n=1 Tax=Jatrophihabitans sp. TaxID=1932789 RepID=UPI003F822D35